MVNSEEPKDFSPDPACLKKNGYAETTLIQKFKLKIFLTENIFWKEFVDSAFDILCKISVTGRSRLVGSTSLIQGPPLPIQP